MKTIDTPWGDRVLVTASTPHPPSAPSPLTRGEGYPNRAGRDSVAFSPPQRGEGARRADEGFWFTPAELAIANSFKLASRREEWRLSRIVAKQLAMQLGVADDPRAIGIGRPFLNIDGVRSDWRVSLSHSAPYAGAAIAREPIGIDVQLLRELDERAAHLFLAPEETDQMLSCSLAHRILHFWCAKEAAWKRRSADYATLRQIPLSLIDERGSSLLFDAAETALIDDVIVAVTRPTS